MSWDNNDERNYSDYGFDQNKHYGETYSESRARQNDQLREQTRENASGGQSSYSDGYTGGSDSSTERTTAAKILIKVGWGLLGSAAILAVTGLPLPKIGNEPFATALASAGAVCLIFGYFAHLIAMAFFAAGFFVIYNAGSKGTSFEFSAVPTIAYLTALSTVVIGGVIGRVFGARN